ncbi:MAG: OmpH family outer membrane protein [Bacteroidales bacterium]|nr:OmpH family outer membrane protein [Bacteroidales bacterium]MBR5922013.1 OmpH family outer membrane protein [Bacteroidales bacterium]
MKKLLLLVAAALLFNIGTADAQKYGHVNSGEILEVMPGIDSLQIKLKAFQEDLQKMYESMMTEYQQKKDKFDREVGTMSSAVRQVREKELQDLATRIQEFQANAQDDLEEKQYELAKPYQDAIQDAINKVAKANGYAYIFDTKILLYYGSGDDITPLVKKELGIK